VTGDRQALTDNVNSFTRLRNLNVIPERLNSDAAGNRNGSAGFGYRASVIGLRLSDIGHRTSGLGHRASDIGLKNTFSDNSIRQPPPFQKQNPIGAAGEGAVVRDDDHPDLEIVDDLGEEVMQYLAVREVEVS